MVQNESATQDVNSSEDFCEVQNAFTEAEMPNTGSGGDIGQLIDNDIPENDTSDMDNHGTMWFFSNAITEHDTANPEICNNLDDAFTGSTTDNQVNESVITRNEKDTDEVCNNAILKIIEASIESSNLANEKDNEKVGDTANGKVIQAAIESSNVGNEDNDNDNVRNAANGNNNEDTVEHSNILVEDNNCDSYNSSVNDTVAAVADGLSEDNADNDCSGLNARIVNNTTKAAIEAHDWLTAMKPPWKKTIKVC